ncbi:enoyl-CoA hydratase/isomerase family protein [Bacillus sp. EB600]|nr:enoyl-CoA hydratase/isomerase family protein [Bacillus sp. EB600]
MTGGYLQVEQEKKVYLKIEEEVGTIYINRPEKRNALSLDMWKGLIQLVNECNENPNVKIIVFRSSSPTAFSAGADISEFSTIRSTEEGAAEYNDITMILEEKIANCLKPSIAMIQGFCVGGGCEIAVACDFRFSDSSGVFGITPAKLGLVYNTPGTKNVVDLVGPSKAKDILLTGRLLSAEEALNIGLIDRIIDSETIEEETYQYAKLISNNAQFAVRNSKRIINEVLKGAVEDSEETAQIILESFTSSDYKEGVKAFLEKRKPKFTYR